MATELVEEAPFWEPGTRIGYHAVTFGWLVGEVIRRVSGQSIGTFFHNEVAKPLGLDFWIGLPVSELGRVTPLRPDPDLEDPVRKVLEADPDGGSLMHLAFENDGGHSFPGGWNTPAAYQAEIGAGGGITNGRSLARMYVPLSLGGTFDGHRFVSPETIRRMGTVQSAIGAELVSGMPMRATLGFQKELADAGLPETAFGHGGWGGSMGFTDPDSGLAFGYVMNQMNTTPRRLPLAKAAYSALGHREGKYGIWVK